MKNPCMKIMYSVQNFKCSDLKFRIDIFIWGVLRFKARWCREEQNQNLYFKNLYNLDDTDLEKYK